MSDVCPKTVWIMSKVWSTTYVCSKPRVQKLKSEVHSMSKVHNPSLKPKSEVCQLSKSKTEVQSQTPKIRRWIVKWNESGFRPPLCTYRITGPGEPPEAGEMKGMTLSSRHRIRNSSPGGLRPSTLPLGHGGSPQYWLSHEPGTLAWKAAVLATTLEPPPSKVKVWSRESIWRITLSYNTGIIYCVFVDQLWQ